MPTKSSIRIGRSPDCEISIEDNMLSRIHCTIEYRDNVGWLIRDGYLSKYKDGSYESKNSTNGTW
jgi:pSer/pThr/pTyr-binding forkhead associated (FHA) protein